MDRLLLALCTFLAALLLPLFVGVLALVRLAGYYYDYRGGDLELYGLYCIPFAVLLCIVASVFRRIARVWNLWLIVVLGFLSGIFVGFISVFAVAIFLGFWFGAMDVPMLESWCVAGAIFIPLECILLGRFIDRAAGIAIFVTLMLGGSLFIGFRPLWIWLVGGGG